MLKPIVFVKFGGSLITDKSTSYKANIEIIKKLANEFFLLQKANPSRIFILGIGSGSFGHYAVKKFLHADDGQYGILAVQNAVKTLHLIVMEALYYANNKCFSCSPSSMNFFLKNQNEEADISPVLEILSKNIVPVLHGDILYDGTILSTEMVFEKIINFLIKKNYIIDSIIYLTNVSGFYDKEMKTISKITPKNWENIQDCIYRNESYDVTGGIKHKIESSLELLKNDITTYIINGNEENSLLNALNKEVSKSKTIIYRN